MGLESDWTEMEILFLAAFLDELFDRFDLDGCNDMYLPNTAENQKFILDVQAAQEDWTEKDRKQLNIQESPAGGKPRIVTSNIDIVKYLIAKFNKLNNVKDEDIPDIHNWGD